MLLEIDNKPLVRYTGKVLAYFNDLTETLIYQDYFGFVESALLYIEKMRKYIEKNIAILPKYPAPHYFDKYQIGMQYITYQPNKRTTWYIFFRYIENYYLIDYVTNNHFEGQYIR